jgi:UDP-N-acetylmuramoylalanine--D-glutamate ligase
MAGVEDHHPVLDCRAGDGPVRADDIEAAMIEIRGKAVLVAGMARSGIAAVELLLKHGAVVRAADERSADQLGTIANRLEDLGVPLLPQTEDVFTSVDLVVLSPGVPVDAQAVNAARSKNIPVIGDVELASYFLKGPIIGITGANGKTTTTAMIGHILGEAGLPRQVGGNIGTPLASMVESSRDDQWNILELSSFQLETIGHFRARIGVCLNVTPDHLDRHHTFESYASAKARLFETQTASDFAVLNADDATCVAYGSRTNAETWWFSSTREVRHGSWLDSGNVILAGDPLVTVEEISLRGMHNVENTMAAALSCLLAGTGRAAIAEGIRTFPGVEHRLEFVRAVNGVLYYNDSKATNVDATEKAIDAFPGGLWIILGGKDKNGDYTVLREKLRKKARKIFLIGAAAEKIASQLDGLPLAHAGTLDNAVQKAASEASAGDVVLLAPACASFDQFDNFEHRGKFFKEVVRAL